MIYYFAPRLGGINGADQAAADILTCLRATEMPVTVFSQKPSQLPGEVHEIKLSCVTWLRAPRYPTFPKKLEKRFVKDLAKWFIYGVQDLPLYYGMYRHLRRHKPSLSIFNDVSPSPGLAARLRRSGKVAGVIHDSPLSLQFFFNSFSSELTERWAEALAKAFDTVIFVSARGRDEWLAFEPLKDKETYVISNCCREAEVQRLRQQDKLETRAELGIKQESFVIACVGTLIPRKAQDLLVEVLPELVKTIPELVLYLVGPDGSQTKAWSKALRDRVAEADLTEYVKFVGPRKDAVAFTYAADTLILPSRAETQGVVILEAMALKVPVIAADIGGIPELIRHNENGLLFPVDDAKQLSENIQRLYNDRNLRKALAERVSESYWQHFSQKDQIKRYREALQHMLADQVQREQESPRLQ